MGASVVEWIRDLCCQVRSEKETILREGIRTLRSVPRLLSLWAARELEKDTHRYSQQRAEERELEIMIEETQNFSDWQVEHRIRTFAREYRNELSTFSVQQLANKAERHRPGFGRMFAA